MVEKWPHQNADHKHPLEAEIERLRHDNEVSAAAADSYMGSTDQPLIQIGGKAINLGRYVQFDDAILARKEASLEYFGEYARQ